MLAHTITSEDGLKVLGSAVPHLQRYLQCVVVVQLQAAFSVPLLLGQEQVVVVGSGLRVQVWSC